MRSIRGLNDNGRIVIAVLPLIVLGTLTIRWADMRLFIRALEVVVWVDVLLYHGCTRHVQPIHGVLRKGNFFGLTVLAPRRPATSPAQPS